MADASPDRIVVATQFSRLRALNANAASPPDIDVNYEALAALAEALELLSQSLLALQADGAVNPLRLRRLDERVSLLVGYLEPPAAGALGAARPQTSPVDSNEPLSPYTAALSQPAVSGHPRPASIPR